MSTRNQRIASRQHRIADSIDGRRLDRLFFRQAERTPERIAVVAGGDRISFAALAARARRIAAVLERHRLEPEDRVAICQRRGGDLVASLLGVLAAGGAYVPLDPSYPRQRLAFMTADSGARLVLADGDSRAVLTDLPEGCRVLEVDRLGRERADDTPGKRLPRAARSDRELAYLIYTSGSTGRPKGVAVEHASVGELVAWSETLFAAGELEGVLASTSVCFDLSVFELFVPLCRGGTALVVEDALALGAAPETAEVRLVNTVPSAMGELVRRGPLPRSVRTVNLAGEPVRRRLVDAVYTSALVERVFDLYGPSEDTVYSTGSVVAEDEAGEPRIGRPLPGTRAHVVGRSLRALPQGTAGELVLGGAGLARGYHDRPALTAERFVPDPFADAPGERLYKTGDRVRLDADGELDYLGRLDHQVKIRGFRIELGEIEVRLGACSGVEEAVVAALPAGGVGDGDSLLVGYVGAPTLLAEGPSSELSVEPGERLRRRLAEVLPDHMVPAAVCVLAALPRTPNGKVDRAALPDPFARRRAAASRLASELPANKLERRVADAFGEALGIAELGPEESLFELGGHSLTAARIASGLASALGLELAAADVLAAVTPRSLARVLAAGLEERGAVAASGPAAIPRADRAAPLPLSATQARLWFEDRREPGSTTYNVPLVVRLAGRLDVAALVRSLDRVVRRHEALRTVIVAAPSDGEPAQRILPPTRVSLPVIDLCVVAAPERLRARRLAVQESGRPFDLKRGPPWRATLLRRSPADHALLLDIHHIATDGWSTEVLLTDLAAAYRAETGRAPFDRPELTIQVADFAAWQRRRLASGAIEEEIAYWRERLEGAPQTIELPFDRPRAAAPGRRRDRRSGQWRDELPPAVSAAIGAAARRLGTTPFVVYLAGFVALLLRLAAARRDLVIGVPEHGRARSELRDLVGFFANTLPLRFELDASQPVDGPSFDQLVAVVAEATVDGLAHGEVPFDLLVERLAPDRSRGSNPFFEVMFAFEHEIDLAGGFGDLAAEVEELASPEAKVDLGLLVEERRNGGFATAWRFRRSLFDPTTVGRLARQYATLLSAATSRPEARLGTLPMLDAGQRHQLLVEWSSSRDSYPDRGTVGGLFLRQATLTPDAIAIVAEASREGAGGRRHLSYRQLAAAAAVVAGRLVERGVGPESRVALVVERSVEMVVGMLGILFAGGAYVPVDPGYPRERRRLMLDDSGARWAVTAAGTAIADLAEDAEVVAVEEGAVSLSSARPTEHPALDPDHPAYVIYTSGSTGRPKGVVIPHRAAANRLLFHVTSDLAEQDRFLQKTTMSFDVSVLEIFAPLLRGATTVLARPGGQRDLEYLLILLAEERLTHTSFPPALLSELLDGDEFVRLPALASVVSGGETVPAELAARFHRRMGPVEFYNRYGPTETTVSITSWRSSSGRQALSLPIGRPIARAHVYVVDRGLRLVPPGVTGELIAGGVCLARGYLDRPALTAARFVPDASDLAPGSRLYRTGDLVRWRADGAIDFVGRIDEQVKIRGFRVELGEITARLERLDGVREVAVVDRPDPATGSRRLVAYLVPSDPSDADDGAAGDLGSRLRERLAEQLPSYMVPSAFVELPGLPLTATGKVDRQALPEPDWSDAGAVYEAPRTPVESALAELFSQVLGVERVGRQDDFFELGGHSLLATRLVARVRERLGADLPLARLFEHPTVALCARFLASGRAAAETEEAALAPPPIAAPSATAAARRGEAALQRYPLSFAQQRLWFLEEMQPGTTAYHVPLQLDLKGELDVEALAAALAAGVARHGSLRTTISWGGDGSEGGEPRQVVEPAGVDRPSLPVVDLSAVDARRDLLRRLVDSEYERRFDLRRGPLLRAVLLRFGGGAHRLILDLHHIVTDGLSMSLLHEELGSFYGRAIELRRGGADARGELVAQEIAAAWEAPAVQYGDYAVWQRRWISGSVEERLAAYWRSRLVPPPEAVALPADRPLPSVQTFRGGSRLERLPAGFVERLERRAHELHATPYMVFLAAFSALLSRLTGQVDVAIASPVGGRPLSELEGVVGFFVNTLALRIDLAGDVSFAELVGRVRESVLGGFSHQHLPFDRVVEEVAPERDLSRPPLAQVLCQLRPAAAREHSWGPVEGSAGGGIEVSIVEGQEESVRFFLELDLIQRPVAGTLGGGEVSAIWRFNRDLFDPTSVARWGRGFELLLADAIAAPATSRRPLSDLALLAPAERQQVLVEWNDTAADFPALGALERSPGGGLAALIAGQAEATPDRIALAFEDEALSFRELGRRVRAFARRLRAAGAGPGERVGVMAERSLELVIALASVLEAGAAYVPLDPDYPEQRLAGMVEDADLAALVVPRRLAGRVPAEAAAGIDRVELARGGALPGSAGEAEDSPVGGLDDPAYMIFTSGSTGRPKGAVNAHRGIVNRLLWIQDRYPIGAGDRVLQKTPVSFDVSVWELFWPLVAGSTLEIARPGGHRDPAYLAALIRDRRITTLHFVPSMLALFLDEPATSGCRPVRRVVASGEALPYELERRFYERLPWARLHNLYGPTEAAVEVTWWPCEPGGRRGRVPIGRPVANTRIEVLDRQGRPVPPGVAGELVINGVQVGGGYFGRPALTAGVFVPDPRSPIPGRSAYRTGDRVRFLADGAIEYLGRFDHQVKLRGLRIELGEIESVLLETGLVREGVVLAREDEPGDAVLVAYAVPVSASGGDEPAGDAAGTELSAEEEEALRERLRREAGRSLPEYMVPSAFVFLPALPLTPNGKLDRRALPAPERRREVAAPLRRPATDLERLLADLWRESLGLGEIGVDDDFFRLGGNSLRGALMINQLRERLPVPVEITLLFETPTIAGLAARLEERLAESADEVGGAIAAAAGIAVAALPAGAPRPLSYAQERLWFLDRLEPGLPTYHVPLALALDGDLRPAALTAALERIVERHEVLRGRFVDREDGPVQVIGPVRVALPVVDLTRLAGGRRDEAALELARREARRPFDLAADRPLRHLLLRLAGERSILVTTFHHIVSDGWSLDLFEDELAAFYSARVAGRPPAETPPELPEIELRYADYAVWQRRRLAGAELERQVAFWRRSLSGIEPLDLPLDHPRPTRVRYRGSAFSWRWPAELLESLERRARDESASLFMVLLALFAALLARHSSQGDLVVGTPVAGRNRRQLEPLIGFFVNTLAVRIGVEGGRGLAALLRRVRSAAVAAFDHAELPFEKVVEALQPERDPSRTPLFQAMFTLEEETGPAKRRRPMLAGVSAARLGLGSTVAKFELTLTFRRSGDGLLGQLELNRDLFDRSTGRRLADHLGRLARAAVADPSRPLAEVPLTSAAERQQALVEWNDRVTAYPASETLPALFARVAAARPEAPALQFDDRVMTYGELDAESARLARYLRRLGIGPEVAVGLSIERSLAMVVATLAILRAGGAYLPFDPETPPERIAFLLDDAGSSLVLTTTDLADRLPAAADRRVICLDRDRALWTRPEPGEPAAPDSRLASSNLAYVIFTSGSTGRPKGVAVPHSAVIRLVRDTDYVALGPDDRIAQASNIAFDAATFELWGALLNGGRLVGIAKQEALTPARLAERIRDDGITTLFLTTALFNQVAREEPAAFAPLEQLLFGGEQVDPDLVARVLAAGPPRRLLHVYGPTESTTYATWHRVSASPIEGATVPIGMPLANTTCVVADAAARPVPPGVFGEILLGGDGLARGYLNRPALTAARFVPDPLTGRGVGGPPGGRLYRTGDRVRQLHRGEVEFGGRYDFQVKIRGFRIELGEVETALFACPEVGESVVLAREDRPGERRLVAYVVPAGEAAAGTGELVELLKRRLGERLPPYMVPSAFVVLDDLPLNRNGKVDRRALPAPDAAAAAAERDFVAPRGPVEEALGRLFEEVLAVAPVGRDDDFFELGGHSLLATRLAAQIRRTFGREVPLRTVLERPTVAGLAAVIAVHGGAAADEPPPLVAGKRASAELPLSFAQRRLWFIDRLSPGSGPRYTVPLQARLVGRLDVAALRTALTAIVERHEVLRSRFGLAGDEPVQTVEPAGIQALPTVDLSALAVADCGIVGDRLARREARRRFDLETAPLVRSRLLRLNARQHLLLVTFHHIVADGWSMGVFLDELGRLYRPRGIEAPEAPPLPELAVQYADFALWQRAWLAGERLESRLATSIERLRGLPPLDLATDRPRPAVQTFEGGVAREALSGAVTARLDQLARRHGATLFMVLAAGWQVLLARSSGQSRFTVGTPSAGRAQPEVENLIGFFVNTLVLRADLAADPTFGELLDRVRADALEAFSQEDVPFERLVEALEPQRRLDRPPIFQTMMTLHSSISARAADPALELAGLDCGLERVDLGEAKFELGLAATTAGEGLELLVDFNRALFDESRASRMVRQLVCLLAGAAADPETRVAALPMLPSAERHQLVFEHSGSRPRTGPPTDLFAAFAARAEERPDAVALTWGDGGASAATTYGKLVRRARAAGRALARYGVGPGTAVGLHLPSSAEQIVALLGVLARGAFYVPLDPAHPVERTRRILDDCRPTVVVTSASDPASLADHGDGRRIVPVDELVAAPADEEAEEPADRTDLTAYVIYTSGSTGLPNGVPITHRAAAGLIGHAVEHLAASPSARVLRYISFGFDASVLETFLALASGATLAVATGEAAVPGPAMAERLVRQRVSHLVATPSGLALLDPRRLPDLAVVSIGGERCSGELARRWSEVARTVNCYGPTETTIYATAEPCAPDLAGDPPIGRPVSGLSALVLDRRLRAAPLGVQGELALAGAGLSRGYLERPALTAERFVPHPFAAVAGERLYRTGDLVRRRGDGRLDFLGRLDHQVKVRGLRIELGEIEAALAAHPAVRSAAAIAVGEEADRALAAFVVVETPHAPPSDDGAAETGSPGLLDELRRRLEDSLPPYMQPSRLSIVDDLPRTPTGKTDRRALAERALAEPSAAGSIGPRDDLEALVVDTFEEVLGRLGVGVRESFFELGGHSLSAVRLSARLGERAGVELPLTRLFEAPTPEALASWLRRRGEIGSLHRGPVCLRRAATGSDEPPWFFVHPVGGSVFCYRGLARRLGGEGAVYAFAARGLTPGEAPLATVEELAEAYLEELRAELSPADRPRRIRLAGWSFGGLVAFEMARRLRGEAGRTAEGGPGIAVERLVLIDSAPVAPPASSERPASPSAGAPASGAPSRAVADEDLALGMMIRDLGGLSGHRLSLDPEELEGLSTGERRARLIEEARRAGALPADADDELLARLLAVYAANVSAAGSYRPRDLPPANGHGSLGRLDLIVAEGGDARRLSARWRRVAEVTEHPVPGDHYSLLGEPAVGEVARRLSAPAVGEALAPPGRDEDGLPDPAGVVPSGGRAAP